MLIDTHSHLYLSQFDDDSDAMLKRASEAGIDKILLPNIDLGSIAGMYAMADQYPNFCYPMMGLHPCDVKEDFERVLDQIYQQFSRRNFVAVGEIGIDLYWDKTTLAIQQQAFRIQVQWAKELDLPIVIHARESFDELFALMDELYDDRLKGVFHCFTGNLSQAQKIMDYQGFLMGIGGVLTYPKSGLEAVVKDIPMEYLVLETDSPFLPPVPFRGKRNESAYVRIVAEKLAECKGISLEEVGRITTANACKLFNLST